ncbi:nitrilase-related carbon-nitrogen hydrolase [Nonomuraea turcica]|uniref:nitrilase-related carbon-nitrogen hydrolase n=1 Tax=Nonomuraea sp. G32 TaxID=3067274 RepID=UPI00273B0507|nr:nitrilase-related carbon-nitrogen hydrolase [Nonomuraea sp. G32]MDP4501758.1 nitrilase-related carbon-nitrogen hydrolase [Nonomuraea sp. G32]
MKVLTRLNPPPSPARVRTPQRSPLRVGLVQHAWRPDPDELTGALTDAIGVAARAGAEVVFLPELTLAKYPAHERATGRPGDLAESLTSGPTYTFAAGAAKAHGVFVHASVYERADGPDGLGFNTAILVSPEGDLVGRTRKLHIPVTDGYYEDTYFRAGPADDPYPVYEVDRLRGVRLGLPTCWDQWFPELARAYSVAGAEVVVYPTAIGSEPAFPEFDTQPLWQQVIAANGITAGTFMVVPNRTGDEGALRFYGSSFISDPYGRVLVQAPRDEEAVLVADLDLEQRRDWLDLFPFLTTRRPDTYGPLTAPADPGKPYGEVPA